MSWTDGYISDVRYPAFFYKEMQPLWLASVAAFSGFAVPDIEGPFALCELGCGVGVNLLVAAACHPQAQFTGVDFNPDHLDQAREAARAAGLGNVEFVHADFAGFARDNGRQFDFVTSHGVWSWIAQDQRAALLDAAAGGLKGAGLKGGGLKSGGLFALHYMCHPGSTDVLPFQHLLNLCAHLMPGPSPRKAQVGLSLLQQVAAGGLYADRPDMLRHLAKLARRDPADLAHEFLTDHWQPQHSVDVHQQAEGAGLAWLASADVFNNLDPSLSIPGKLQDLIRQTRVPALAETLKDMARNSHQRFDLFQKEPRALDREGYLARLEAMRFRLLPGAPAQGPVEFATPIGPVVGPAALFTSLLERLGQGGASWAQLLQLPAFGGDAGSLLQSLQLLMMQQYAHPVLPGGGQESETLAKLSAWFDASGIALDLVGACATALTR